MSACNNRYGILLLCVGVEFSLTLFDKCSSVHSFFVISFSGNRVVLSRGRSVPPTCCECLWSSSLKGHLAACVVIRAP